MLGISV